MAYTPLLNKTIKSYENAGKTVLVLKTAVIGTDEYNTYIDLFLNEPKPAEKDSIGQLDIVVESDKQTVSFYREVHNKND